MRSNVVAIKKQKHELVRYEEMCRAIDAAYKVDEVKDIHDRAAAIAAYARQAKNFELERRACEIRLRAERKGGQLLKQMEKQQGARGNPGGRGAKVVASRGTTPQLKDLGITRDQSSNWQKLADIPEEGFEQEVVKPGATTKGIIATFAKPKPVDKVDARALWLWGRLKDFDRDGLLDLDPNTLLTTMMDHMRTTTKELAPRVAKWLGRIKP